MKNLIIGITLLILFSCSSNPKIITEVSLEEQLIEKPQINYKLNSLPKDINVIYFSDSKKIESFPDEVKGLLTNYYYFSKKNNYFPNINFINLKKIDSCNVNINREAFHFIFLLHDSFNSISYDLCLNRFTNLDVLLVSDFVYKSAPKSFKKFLIDRNEDKFDLIKFMYTFSKNIVVIDNEITNDKYEIGDIWNKEFNKEIVEFMTFNKEESSQALISNLLLLEQSLKRKRKLSRLISKDLEHKSRARGDIDALFLSVNVQEARSLKPALDYNYFDYMEVFLANDWEGDIQLLKTDKDLEGVISIDIPFMLETSLPSELKSLQEKSRNFAIGYDAFEIVALMKGARNLNRINYKGLTGRITFRDKTIERESKIFRIKNGIYEYLN